MFVGDFSQRKQPAPRPACKHNTLHNLSSYNTASRARKNRVEYPFMNLYEWNQVTCEQLNPRIKRQAIHSGSMTIARLELMKDAVVPEHSHHNEQVSMVERGALQFAIEGGQ